MPLPIKQLHHHEVTNDMRTSSVILVCDGVESPANAGAIIRLAEAFGVEQVYFCNANINFNGSRFKRTARSAEQYMVFNNHDNAQELIQELTNDDYTTIGLEITTNSLPLDKFDVLQTKIALVIGSESMGISQDILNALDHIIYIPMYGKNSSMNVGHACAIALYKLTQPQHAPQI